MLMTKYQRKLKALPLRIGILITVGLLPLAAQTNSEKKPMAKKTPTVQEAKKFIEDAEARLLELNVEASRAD